MKCRVWFVGFFLVTTAYAPPERPRQTLTCEQAYRDWPDAEEMLVLRVLWSCGEGETCVGPTYLNAKLIDGRLQQLITLEEISPTITRSVESLLSTMLGKRLIESPRNRGEALYRARVTIDDIMAQVCALGRTRMEESCPPMSPANRLLFEGGLSKLVSVRTRKKLEEKGFLSLSAVPSLKFEDLKNQFGGLAAEEIRQLLLGLGMTIL